MSSTSKKQEKRPSVVTLVAVLSTIVGVVHLFSVMSIVSAFMLTTEEAAPALPSSAIMMTILPISLGVAYLVTTTGLLKTKRWAWIAAQRLSIITIALSAVMILMGNTTTIMVIVVAGVLLYYLHHANVKQYFKTKRSA